MTHDRLDAAAARALGVGCILVGIAANRYVLALLSPDGDIASPLANVAILAFEVACIAAGIWLMRRRPPGSVKAALALGATLLAWGVAEVVALATGFLVPREFRVRHQTFYQLYQPDSTLGFRMRPNLSGMELLRLDDGFVTRYDTDARGFRNVGRDYGAARVWVMGDSFAFGVWVDRDSTFYGALERSLGEPVVTLATPGYDLAQYAITLDQQLAANRPDVIVLCIFANDLKEQPSVELLRDYYRAQRWDRFRAITWREKLVTRRLLGWLPGFRDPALDPANDRIKAANGVWLYREFGPRANYFADSQHVETEAQLERIIERSARDSVRLLVFLLPSRESVHHEEFLRWRGPAALAVEEEGYRRFCALAARRQVPCYDLTDAFRREAEREILYFRSDAHWNTRGHAFAEQLMRPHVAAQLRATVAAGSGPAPPPPGDSRGR